MATLETPQAPKSSFVPDMSWTQRVPQSKRLNCIAAAAEMFAQAEQKLAQVEKTGLDRAEIRVAAFMPRLPNLEVDRGSRRYASYMGKQFRQHGLDFRVEEAQSADALELLLMGAQVYDKIYGTFIFFPAPYGKTEDYFLRRVRPEKDIEGLTVENTGRMALNIKSGRRRREVRRRGALHGKSDPHAAAPARGDQEHVSARCPAERSDRGDLQ